MSEEKKNLLVIAQEAEGFLTVIDMLEAACADVQCPGVCVECREYVAMDVEPDQDRGWCENCEKPTVKSVLVLAGMI